MNATRDTSPLESQAHGDLPQGKLAHQNALCPRGVFRRAGLGAERQPSRVMVRFPWEPAVATNGGGLHFTHLIRVDAARARRLVTGHDEPAFPSIPTND